MWHISHHQPLAPLALGLVPYVGQLCCYRFSQTTPNWQLHSHINIYNKSYKLRMPFNPSGRCPDTDPHTTN